MVENVNLEFKSQYTDKLYRTVIAFANGAGGSLYIGVNDDGSVCGVDDVDDVQLRLKNQLKDAIRPDILLFTRITAESMDGKTVVRVDVGRGTMKPYYAANKGLRSEGVYVRNGASNDHASEQSIREMIVMSSKLAYEREPTLNVELTFIFVEDYFRRKGVDFGESHFRQLGFRDEYGRLTNLALLFSDQNPHSLKIGVFSPGEDMPFQDRAEFGGSILSQLEAGFGFIGKYNRKRATYRNLERIDQLDYDVECLREALVNCLVHCDYAQSAATRIEIFEDRMSFVNMGGLVEGLSFNDLEVGASKCRNERLASIFYRLRLVESYGTGLRKILNRYSNCNLKDIVEVSDHVFRLTLARMVEESASVLRKADEAVSAQQKRRDGIMALFNESETITRKNVQDRLGCSLGTAIRDLEFLTENGYVRRMGMGRATVYAKMRGCHAKG